jgi:hypothetical protein
LAYTLIHNLPSKHPLRDRARIAMMQDVIRACEYGSIEKLLITYNKLELESCRAAKRIIDAYSNGKQWYKKGRHLSDDLHTKKIMAILEISEKMHSLSIDEDTFKQEISSAARRFKIVEDELLSALNDMADNIEMELERYALAQIHN